MAATKTAPKPKAVRSADCDVCENLEFGFKALAKECDLSAFCNREQILEDAARLIREQREELVENRRRIDGDATDNRI